MTTINPDEEDEDSLRRDEKKSTDPSVEKVVLGVHAGDSLYAEVRNHHVEKFGSFLQNQALALKESHANFTNKGTKKDLSEIHQFVKQIPVSTLQCCKQSCVDVVYTNSSLICSPFVYY